MALRLRALLALVAAVALATIPPRALACGPFFPAPVFVFDAHPDRPFDPFAAGRLGILRPGYARSYLVVAFRHLGGRPLSAAEQKAAAALWEKRLTASFDEPGQAWIEAWLKARSVVAGAGEPPKISVQRNFNGPTYYFDILNCPEDAFRTAAATLQARVQKLGASSPAVLDWVQAQDRVFAACSGQAEPPQAAPAGADPGLAADRVYQTAAYHFYAGELETAAQGFDAIAKDASSPWHGVAPYLAARALIRSASVDPRILDGNDPAAAAQLLQRAAERLQAVAADPSAAALQQDARRMLNLVELRLHTTDRLGVLARALAGPQPDPDFYQDLWDYTTALDRLAPAPMYGEEPTAPAASTAVPKDQEMTDWVLSFQASDDAAAGHALDRWRSTRSDAWLVAALVKADARSDSLADLLDGAAKLQPGSPAFWTAAYHAVRLLIDAGRGEEARTRLDALLGTAELPDSARNLFLAQRMRLARSLDELLRDAQRRPLVVSLGIDAKQEPVDADSLKYLEQEGASTSKAALDRIRDRLPALDEDGVRSLDALPVALLAQAAANPALPEHLQRDLALVAWTRALLLDDEATALSVLPQLQTLVPELKSDLDAYRGSPDTASRRFAGILLLLRFPGAQPSLHSGVGRLTRVDRIDDYRDNWWCASKADAGGLPAFLDAARQQTGREEKARLAALGTGPNWLSAQALEWAKAHPEDPSVPEALHLAVRTTRYGCTDEGTAKLSKAAFQLLHKNHPKSDWTKKTPHWFD
jgi:hypothetical protein